MIYPKFIEKGDIIGVTAPSDGVTDIIKLKRLEFAIKNLENEGFRIRETSDVRTSFRGKSAASDIQARELISLYKDLDVAMIWCSGGGDFLLEILPFVDFREIRNNPKWLQGYSDPTGLLFVITTNLDIATIYGDNFCSFGMNPWHESLKNNLEILKGNIISQKSFLQYESTYTEYISGDETFNLDKKGKWEDLRGDATTNFRGRIIGGCIDILTDIFGTRFDKTLEFIEKYREDGIVWYFDNCEKSYEDLIRILWKFKDKGWFLNTTGIIFGRSVINTSCYGFTLKEAIGQVLGELDIPIVINADIGHVAPRMTIINGAIADVRLNNGKGIIDFWLE